MCVEKSHVTPGIYCQQPRWRRLRRNSWKSARRMFFSVMNQLAESGRQFDLILADPPYGEKNVNRRSTSFAQQMLRNDKNLPKLLASGGRFVLGHTKRRHAGNRRAVDGSENAQARRYRDAVFGVRRHVGALKAVTCHHKYSSASSTSFRIVSKFFRTLVPNAAEIAAAAKLF